MERTDEMLLRIKQIVNAQEPTAQILLYGSRARGNATCESDWDLLILVDKDEITMQTERKITYPLYDLEFETGEIISPMIYSNTEWNTKYKVTPYYQNVMKDGVLL